MICKRVSCLAFIKCLPPGKQREPEFDVVPLWRRLVKLILEGLLTFTEATVSLRDRESQANRLELGQAFEVSKYFRCVNESNCRILSLQWKQEQTHLITSHSNWFDPFCFPRWNRTSRAPPTGACRSPTCAGWSAACGRRRGAPRSRRMASWWRGASGCWRSSTACNTCAESCRAGRSGWDTHTRTHTRAPVNAPSPRPLLFVAALSPLCRFPFTPSAHNSAEICSVCL